MIGLQTNFYYKGHTIIMSHSFSKTIEQSCPNCHRTFDFEVWLIVDTSARLDLLKRVQEETIHSITCPHCNISLGEIDAPLLLYCPGKVPPFVFSPAQHTMTEQDQRHSFDLINQLRGTLGASWQHEWLTYEIPGIPRPLLMEAFYDLKSVVQKLDDTVRERMVHHSESIQTPITCPDCNHKFTFDVWLIIDVNERPDLFQRVQEETIHHITCPRCTAVGEVDAPLLLYFSWKNPPFVFSPAQKTTSEDDKGQLLDLINSLRAALGSFWQNEWFNCEIPIIPRQFLKDELSSKTQKPTSPQNEQLSHNSHAEQAPMICPNCNQEFNFDIWVIVDINERPDLLERILKSRLHRFSCPYCGFTDEAAVPFIVMSLSEHPFLIYSVTEYPPDEKDEELFSRFLGLLYPKIEDEKLRRLVEECEVIPELSLPSTLTNKISSHQSDDEDIMFQLGDMLETMERELKEEHPEAFRQLQEEMNQELLDNPNLPPFPNFITGTPLSILVKLLPIMQQLGQLSENVLDMPQRIELCKRALSILPREQNPFLWASFHQTLASALTFSPHGDKSENIENAIRSNKLALEIVSQQEFPEQWADLQHILANAYSERRIGDQTENTELSIHHYLQSLEVFTQQKFPQRWAYGQYHLALAYASRTKVNQLDKVEDAIKHGLLALEVYTFENHPKDWARTHNNLASICGARAIISSDKRETYIERAISHCRQALKVFISENYREEYASIHNNLGLAYSYRLREGRAKNVAQAIAHFKQALKIHTRTEYPFEHFKDIRNLGDLYFMEGRWSDAMQAYMDAIQTGEILLQTAYSDISRRAEIENITTPYANVAYCLLHLGRYDEALEQLEAGKTRLLSEALALNDANLDRLSELHRTTLANFRQIIRSLETEYRLPPDTPGRRSNVDLMDELRKARSRLNTLIDNIRAEHPDFMPKGLTLPNILSLIPLNGALVAPLFTTQGGAAFIVPHNVKAIKKEHIVWLNDFTEDQLKALLVGSENHPGWLWLYLDSSKKTWRANFEDFTEQLWRDIFAPIQKQLQTFDTKHIILMPQGGLGLLPLHAAWRKDNNRKRYLIDDYTISYTPSAHALHAAHRHLQNHDSRKSKLETRRNRRERFSRRRIDNQQSALVVGVSEYRSLKNLPCVRVEVETIAKFFDVTALVDQQATRQAVLKRASGSTYLHLACHGIFGWGNTLSSRLILANNEPLSLGDILSYLDLETARLVTLSACETGITDIHSPDEYVGLPAGFMQSGAPGVISSLWSVDDYSTALLMEQFYRYHFKEKMTPSEALRAAQIWLRDATRQKLGDYLLTFISLTRMSSEHAQAMQASISLSGPPDEKPYMHPYYWAAFTFNGI